MHDIYLETGKKKTFACAMEWPGWCRSGKDEASAVQALLEYAPRYARVLESTKLPFSSPEKPADLAIIERVRGNVTTDFSVPEIILKNDSKPVSSEELKRYQAILRAAWLYFDRAVNKAEGKHLRKGPRGGGRELDAIIRHVLGGDESYLSRIGRKVRFMGEMDAQRQLDQVRQEMLLGIAATAEGKVPAEGPRGGKIWPLRYYLRRATWHVVDHAWEIEDRINCF